MRNFLLLAVLALAGCVHVVTGELPRLDELRPSDASPTRREVDLAVCYDGLFNAWCVVRQPPGTAVSTGQGIVPGVGSAVGGVGTLLIGQGAVISGVATVVK